MNHEAPTSCIQRELYVICIYSSGFHTCKSRPSGECSEAFRANRRSCSGAWQNAGSWWPRFRSLATGTNFNHFQPKFHDTFPHWIPPRTTIFHPASVSQMLRNMLTAPQPAPNSKTRQFKPDFSTWGGEQGVLELSILQWL